MPKTKQGRQFNNLIPGKGGERGSCGGKKNNDFLEEIKILNHIFYYLSQTYDIFNYL